MQKENYPIEKGTWQHAKNNNLYEVIDFGFDTERNSLNVNYISLYESKEHPRGTKFHRSLSSWLEEIELPNGNKSSRFVFIGKIRYWIKIGDGNWSSVSRQVFIQIAKDAGLGEIKDDRSTASFSTNNFEGRITFTDHLNLNENQIYTPDFVAAFENHLRPQHAQ